MGSIVAYMATRTCKGFARDCQIPYIYTFVLSQLCTQCGTILLRQLGGPETHFSQCSRVLR